MRWFAETLAARFVVCKWLLLGIILFVAASGHAADEVPVTRQLALDTGGHTGWVRRVLVDKYRQHLISVADDKTIRIWSLDTFEPLQVLRPPIGRGREGELYSAALSPDGSLLAVSGFMAPEARGDHRVLLIGLPGGEMVARLQGSTAAIYGLDFSPDGRWLAAGGDDGIVRVWEVATRKLAYAWSGHTKRITDLAWNPAGTQLASCSWDYTARLWAIGKGQIAVRPHGKGLLRVAWSHDGKWLATGGSEETIRLWDQAGRVVMAVKVPRTVEALRFSGDDRRLAYGYGSRFHPGHGAGMISVPDGALLKTFDGHRDTSTDARFVDGDRRVVIADAHGDMCVWDTSTGRLVHRLRSAGAELYANGWSPDGRAIAYGYLKKPGSSLKATNPLEHSFCLEQLDFGPLPDKLFRAAETHQGDLSIERVKWRYLLGSRGGAQMWRYEIPVRDANIRSRTLLPGARAAVGFDLGLVVLNSTNGQPIYTLPGHTDAVWAVAPSPDGRYLLTASCDQTLEIWNLANYQLVLSLFFAGDEWIAWTPGGYYAASLAGESLMGWHIQTTPDKMATFYSAARFHDVLYRPDVIRQVLPLGSPLAALREADRQRQSETQPIVIQDHLPPSVAMQRVSPDKNAEESNVQTWRIRALPAGGDPVMSIELLLDGRPLPTELRKPSPADPTLPAGGLETDWTVTLPPGEHALVAKANAAQSYQLSEPATIKPGEKAVRLPRLFVLAIGVSDYDQRTLQIPHAGADAKSLADTLKKLGQAEFSEVLVDVLTDKQVTGPAIETGLDWMKRYAALDDVCVVYFAGRVTSDSHGELLLLPHDASAGKNAGGLSARTLQKSLQATQGKLLFLLDAQSAHAEQTTVVHHYCGDDTPTGVAGDSSAIDQLLRALSSDSSGISVMGRLVGATDATPATAPDAPPAAGEHPAAAAAHGLFAQALLDGLHGQADSDYDGRVDVSELEAFVRTQLGRANAGAERVQMAHPAAVPSYPLTQP